MKKVAVISMCCGLSSPGLKALEDLAREHGTLTGVYDIRVGQSLPDFNDFDLLLSSGGPGDPADLGGWGQGYADLITRIRDHNRANPNAPKRAFLVCHSFQVMSHYWGLGRLIRRDEPLWGVVPQIPQALPDGVKAVFPAKEFHSLESRFFQVTPAADIDKVCAAQDIAVAAKDEKGALTAWQTMDGHIAATQFHPEATVADVQRLLDNPLKGDIYPMAMCDPQMISDAKDNLPLLHVMQQVLVDFITRS